jgi:heme/copper-type cytochrome/quinol oxidase subunit 2
VCCAVLMCRRTIVFCVVCARSLLGRGALFGVGIVRLCLVFYKGARGTHHHSIHGSVDEVLFCFVFSVLYLCSMIFLFMSTFLAICVVVGCFTKRGMRKEQTRDHHRSSYHLRVTSRARQAV